MNVILSNTFLVVFCKIYNINFILNIQKLIICKCEYLNRIEKMSDGIRNCYLYFLLDTLRKGWRMWRSRGVDSGQSFKAENTWNSATHTINISVVIFARAPRLALFCPTPLQFLSYPRFTRVHILRTSFLVQIMSWAHCKSVNVELLIITTHNCRYR